MKIPGYDGLSIALFDYPRAKKKTETTEDSGHQSSTVATVDNNHNIRVIMIGAIMVNIITMITIKATIMIVLNIHMLHYQVPRKGPPQKKMA